jgi:hypothetical protein
MTLAGATLHRLLKIEKIILLELFVICVKGNSPFSVSTSGMPAKGVGQKVGRYPGSRRKKTPGYITPSSSLHGIRSFPVPTRLPGSQVSSSVYALLLNNGPSGIGHPPYL